MGFEVRWRSPHRAPLGIFPSSRTAAISNRESRASGSRPAGLDSCLLRRFQVHGKSEALGEEGGSRMARTDAALMPEVSEAESARGYLGSVFRLTVDFLEQRGCKAQVKQKVSAATAQLIDKPPFPFAWIPATPMDEVESALSLVAGRDACVDLGLTAARKLGGSLIQPVLKLA